MTKSITNPSVRSTVLFAVALFLPVCALAEDLKPLRLGAGLTWRNDSNIFQADSASPGGVSSDQSSSAFAIVNAETTLSRQRLYANFNVGSVKFNRFSYLNYDKQDFSAGWSGEFPHRLNAGLDWSRAQTLASFSDIGAERRNVIRRTALGAHFDLPLMMNWHLIGAGSGSQSRNSNEIDAGSDLDVTSAEGGLRYVTPYGNQLDAVLRSSLSRYPNRTLSALLDTDYREQLADLRVQWAVTGASQLNGHAGYLRRRHPSLGYRNFSGASFRLAHTWQPCGSLGLVTTLYRDMGAAGDNEFDSVVAKGVRIEPGWELSSKIHVGALLEWARRDYLGDVLDTLFGGSLGAGQRRDRTSAAGLTVAYAPSRWANLSASWREEKRDSNRALRNYMDHSGTMNVQLLF